MSTLDEVGNPKSRQRIYEAEPYHIEKYVAPGAVAITVLFLIPWYLLGGSELGGVELGTAVISALVLGHFMESLKVYQWGGSVRKNYRSFLKKVDALIGHWGIIDDDGREKRSVVLGSLFAVIDEGPGSEFAWNLVRWQKMTVIAVVLRAAGILWLLFAALLVADSKGVNPFVSHFTIVVLANQRDVIPTLVADLTIAAGHFVSANYIYQFALDRQVRTNESYFQLVKRYRDPIQRIMAEDDVIKEKETGGS
jgi:hypothetical protein